MYFVPFIYFSALTYYFWQKNRTFDLAVYISTLFTITSFCCIIMVLGGYMSGSGVLVDGWEPNFGVIPTILYCALITITIFPFSFINLRQVEHIGNVHRVFLYFFTGFILLQGLIIFLLTGSFISTLLQGDFKYIKDAGYAGEITPADAMMMTMPLPIQMMYLTCTITLIGIPLFFYYTGIEKKSLWKTAPILAVSISPVLRGILSADRTEIIHYGLMFLFSLVFFQRFITKGMKKFLLLTTIPTIIIGIVYIIAVSTSRFEDTEEGASGSMLEYAGQSYVNFCYFYDNHDNELYYLEREFPMISYFIFKDQYTDTKAERSAKEGFFIGVFASHIGSWYLDTGVIGSLLICIIFAIICCLVIKRYNRTEFDIADVIMIFTLGAVPTFGIFYYRYYSIATAFVYVAAGILYLYSKYIFIWSQEQEKVKI